MDKAYIDRINVYGFKSYGLRKLTIPIKGIYIKGILKPYNEKIEIDGEKIISMIMRDIFSGREYKLLKDGKIMRRD